MAEKKDVSVSDDGKLFGALCYIIGIIVPLFVLFTEKKNDKFLVFHAWQSLMLSVAMIAVWMVFAIGITIISVITLGYGGVLGCLALPLAAVFFIAVLFTAYKAYLGEMYKLPMIGDFAEKQANK